MDGEWKNTLKRIIITITGAKGIAERLKEGVYGNPLVKSLLDIPMVKKYMGDVFFGRKPLCGRGCSSTCCMPE